jgi:hypothetical protein
MEQHLAVVREIIFADGIIKKPEEKRPLGRPRCR